MRIIMNGREVEVPVGPDGSVPTELLWKLSGADPRQRAMILHQPGGRNITLPLAGQRKIIPGSFVSEVAQRRRG